MAPFHGSIYLHNPLFYLVSISPNIEVEILIFCLWIPFSPNGVSRILSQFIFLELVSCLNVTDVPFLIRWLSYLPNIVRLTLKDDVIGQAATSLGQDADNTNLYQALASPRATMNGWLCPSLMSGSLWSHIHCSRKRRNYLTSSWNLTTRSHVMLKCAAGRKGELLDSLVDHTTCLCITCGLALELVGMSPYCPNFAALLSSNVSMKVFFFPV